MGSVRCRLKDGELEFDGPLPEEWVGLELSLQPSLAMVKEAKQDIELDTDEKWQNFFESIKEFQMNDGEYAEFQQILDDQKRLELSTWDRQQQRIDGLFP